MTSLLLIMVLATLPACSTDTGISAQVSNDNINEKIASLPIFPVDVTDQAGRDEGHDILIRELGIMQDKLSATHSELIENRTELSATKNELSITKDKLRETEVEVSDTFITLREVETKLAEADKMQNQYDAMIAGTVEIIKEADVEQALFKIVNQERKSAGLNELIWNGGLYSCADSNNRKMSETKSLEQPECPSLEQVFWFLGYGTSDRITNTALLAWKNNPYSYKQNVLNSKAVSGAVAVYKSEEILYITFLCYTNAPSR